jgi:hypothetical protein
MGYGCKSWAQIYQDWSNFGVYSHFFFHLGSRLPHPWIFLLAGKTPCCVTSMLNGVIFRNSLLKIGDKEFDNKGVIFYLDGQIHFT